MTFVDDLLTWFRGNPGWHRPVDVASDMGVDTHTVAARCNYLSTHGKLLRRQHTQGRARKSVYAAPGNPPA